MSCSGFSTSSAGCSKFIPQTPPRLRRHRESFTPVYEDEGEEETSERSNPAEVGFLPDLEALRFWSHPRRQLNMEPQQGVLWKRRDVFKNRWRPRWFVLQPRQGILTYYLLSSPTISNGSSSAVFTPVTNGRTQVAPLTEPPLRGGSSNRVRATSWDSNVSENTVDFDVVPRGTVFLLGCSIAINQTLSKPSESLFAFTIRPPNTAESHIHLAARTEQSRAIWVEKIARVCGLDNGMRDSVADHTEVSQGGQIEPPLERAVSSGEIQEEISESDWVSTCSDEKLYANVPDTLAEKIRHKIKSYLPLCDESFGWTVLFQNGSRAAYQRKDRDGHTIIKSTAILDHPPKQVFGLLIDITRRQDFETNVRCDDRMSVRNPHTFMDYYAYNAVWPTSAREFAVAVHWQVVRRARNQQTGDVGIEERAILMCSFSCSEADALKPVQSNHVRAELFASLYLLKDIGRNQCQVTRILSFDLAGGLHKKLANAVNAQQANLPSAISDYLGRHERVPGERLLGTLSNDDIIRNVIEQLPSLNVAPRVLTYGAGEERSLNDDDDMEDSVQIIKAARASNAPSLETQLTILLLPVIVFRLTTWFNVPGNGLVFCVCVFQALRYLVYLHLGEILPESNECAIIGPVTCRFSVDLKGILRFIANKKEERDEQRKDGAEVSIVHIVASAVAKALKNDPNLHRRKVCIPWLLIDEVIDASSEPVHVSISENAGGITTIYNADSRDVQSIADELAERENSFEETKDIGQCLVLATPSYEESEIETDVTPIHPNITVVAVIGGVWLEKTVQVQRSGTPSRRRPLLSLSLTISAPRQTDIVSCRKYAEEVRKLLQFPEMCES